MTIEQAYEVIERQNEIIDRQTHIINGLKHKLNKLEQTIGIYRKRLRTQKSTSMEVAQNEALHKMRSDDYGCENG